MNNHVTNLELSKKLAELGVKQDSEFYWVKHNYDWFELEYSGNKHYELTGEYYSAFLSTELGEMLPWYIYTCQNSDGEHVCLDRVIKNVRTDAWAKTEQDARAKCLIWLIENNLIEV